MWYGGYYVYRIDIDFLCGISLYEGVVVLKFFKWKDCVLKMYLFFSWFVFIFMFCLGYDYYGFFGVWKMVIFGYDVENKLNLDLELKCVI